MIYGYGRVSTKGQAKDGNSLEAQEWLLKEHGPEVIYMDSFTGTKMTRPEFDKLLEKLKAGDTLIVHTYLEIKRVCQKDRNKSCSC